MNTFNNVSIADAVFQLSTEVGVTVIVLDKDGNTIRHYEDNDEEGYIVLGQVTRVTKETLKGESVRFQNRKALYKGELRALTQEVAAWGKQGVIPINIIVEEYTTNELIEKLEMEDDSELKKFSDDIKKDSSTDKIMTSEGLPIYRFNIATSDLSRKDKLVMHDKITRDKTERSSRIKDKDITIDQD